MNMKPVFSTLVSITFSSMLVPLAAQSGGALTPPAGAPTPSMKSLDQVEPRTPLVDGAVGVSVDGNGSITISQSGSYYLTGNHSVTGGSGIRISADGVSIDLQGFTITSSSSSAEGIGIIALSGTSNISIINGHVISGTVYNSGSSGDQFTGPGFNYGVYSYAKNTRVSNISVSGCNLDGIFCITLESTIVESCSVNTVGGTGIKAGVVHNCNAMICGGVAVSSRSVLNSTGHSTGDDGIYASSVNNCYGRTSSTAAGSNGIQATRTVKNSYGGSSGGNGIRALLISDSYGYTTSVSTDSHGINADRSVQSCYGYSFAGHGIFSFNNVMNSYGKSDGQDGINAAIISNCYGFTTGSAATSEGIDAGRNVQNSFGAATGGGDGINAINSVMNSYGNSAGGDGIQADIVSFSRGYTAGTNASDDGIQAFIAIGCSFDGGANITNKYQMP